MVFSGQYKFLLQFEQVTTTNAFGAATSIVTCKRVKISFMGERLGIEHQVNLGDTNQVAGSS
jgi:hypothetical protein